MLGVHCVALVPGARLEPCQKALYLKATEVAAELDLSRCASRLGQDSFIEDC